MSKIYGAKASHHISFPCCTRDGMVMEQALGLAELLTASPLSASRQDYSAFRFVPFSRKLGRRVHLSTQDMYALWVRLESDPGIFKFNERVPEVPVVLGAKAVNAAPRAISVAKDRAVTVHTFAGDLERSPDEITTSPWASWSAHHGFSHAVWNSVSLRGNPVRFNNLKRLLRYVSIAGAIPDARLRDALLAELGAVRRLTMSKLVDLFPKSDPTEVMSEIARLILDGTVYSDIDRNSLSMITELSAHHVFETD